MKQVITIIFFCCIQSVQAQQKIFTEKEFMDVVKQFHPVARIAANDIRMARWDITKARGAFDPEWNSQNMRKEFDAITYYNQSYHEIKIPTWYGIDLHAGRETINGRRVNPEETTGSLNYIGFSVPLVQNLVIDKRRAAVMLAKNYHQLSQVHREIALNDLLKESLEAYWDWWEQYFVLEVITKALSNAENRLTLVKSAFRLGDRPAVDTLEAFTQVQSIKLRALDAEAAYNKAQVLLGAYLWSKDETTFDLPADVIPAEINPFTGFTLNEVLTAASSHPDLRQYLYKLNQLNIDKKLNFQLLLPEVKFKYNQLGRGFDKAVNADWFAANYNYGISLSVPLRLSEGRAGYAKSKIAIENTKIEQGNKLVQLQAKVKQYFLEWQLAQNQIALQENLVKNYASLQRAEEIRFSNGESNLFLINAREIRTIESEQKLIETKVKSKKAAVKLQWSAGLLAN